MKKTDNMMISRPGRLLKVSEVAKRLGVSRTMVYQYLKNLQLWYCRLPSGGIRVKEKDLDEFIDSLTSAKGITF